jgi:hypothetical protein
MRAGTSRARTTLASRRTAAAMPNPISLVTTIWALRKAPATTAKSNAAAVTIRPVRSRPTATASASLSPSSRASLIRERRKTP